MDSIKITSKYIDQTHQRRMVKILLPDGSRQRMHYARFLVEVIRRDILPLKAIVHHVNGNSLDDYPSNFAVCEDDNYHRLLHQRTDAYKATGNAHARKCQICKQWGIPGDGDMVVVKSTRYPGGSGQSRHKSCHNMESNERRSADGFTR